MKLIRGVCVAVLLTIGSAAEPCTIARPVSPEEVVRDADVIARAAAVDYARPPRDPTVWTTGQPDSLVRFRLVEVVKGSDVPPELVLPGYLVDKDDFNNVKVPYTFVRPGGQAGSCFANAYRRGAEFLLMLKKRPDRSYTVNWYALGPVNEQLRSANDPWLLWVREQVAGRPWGQSSEEEYRKFIRAVSQDISKLKDRYPQLQEFSSTKHADLTELRVSYGYRTHRAERPGGWSAAVPNPDPDGIWFYIDLHDPDSKAQIHTQPVPNSHSRVGNKSVSFLILEGSKTKPVAGEIAAILKRHGA